MKSETDQLNLNMNNKKISYLRLIISHSNISRLSREHLFHRMCLDKICQRDSLLLSITDSKTKIIREIMIIEISIVIATTLDLLQITKNWDLIRISSIRSREDRSHHLAIFQVPSMTKEEWWSRQDSSIVDSIQRTFPMAVRQSGWRVETSWVHDNFLICMLDCESDIQLRISAQKRRESW